MKLSGWLLCMLLLMLATGRAAAQPGPVPRPLVLSDTTRDYRLGPYADLLVVPTDSALPFARVQAPTWAGRFAANHRAVPNVNGQHEVWLRATVVNAASPHTMWLLRSALFQADTLAVYVEAADGQVQALTLGASGPGARGRAVANRCFNLALPLQAGQPTTIYVRSNSGLLDYRLCELQRLQMLSYWENLTLGIFYGAMLMLALYNLFLFASLRESAYGYYVGYVLAFSAASMLAKGLLMWWLPALGLDTNSLLRLAVSALTATFAALMTRTYLETRRLAPRLDWVLTAIVVTAPLPLLLLWLRPGNTGVLSQVLPLFSGVATLVVALVVLRTGYRPARYYMVGAGLVIVSVFVYLLANLGLLPSNEWTMNGSALAWLLDMVCLSLGLADRVSLARQAQQQAQAEALARLREKEDVQLAANQQLATRATELEHAYHELRASLATTEQLKSLDELKTNFFTNISHEFRTPLTLILGPAEELAEDGADATTRTKATLIQRNAQRLLRLINQLLDLSKLEAGAMRLLPEARDLAALGRHLAATFASMAEARGISFRTEGPARLPFVFDAPKLDVVLTNLLSNALRFTPAGGSIMLSWREVPATTLAPAGVELAVRDTGPGIAPAQRPHLFDRFYQGAHPSTPGTQPGTGVGLALVKELTELHRGTVTVDSLPGAGATFRVWLPQGLRPAPGGSDPARPASADAALAGLLPELAPATALTDEVPREADPEADLVLCIEDNEDVREFIRSSLAPAGYRLLQAPDGLSGVALALEHVPDLIVSDVMMPGLDGYGVVRQLKAHPATSHVPLVLLTARSSTSDRLEGLETGADAYVGKPFAARELRAQVRNLLALRDRNRALTQAARHAAPPAPALLFAAAAPDAPANPEAAAVLAQTATPALLSAIDRSFLERVAAAVALNLGEGDFDVEQLSSAVALSRTQVHRKLRALTGQSPAEYIRLERLERARQLLREQAGTVAEVCYRVGFNSPAHFSTAFSRQYGYPPSEAALHPKPVAPTAS